MQDICLQHSELAVQGDMYGDKILISQSHELRATRIFELILPLVTNKFVVAIGGPSGSGKSEIAALVGTKFIKETNRNSYVISCDNYAHRPPRKNDQMRVTLHANGSGEALSGYLGTQEEADYNRLNKLIADFKANEKSLDLRIMNAKDSCVHMDPHPVDFSGIEVIVLEGTWSHLVRGSDVKVFLETDFEKTLAHRKTRARDPITRFSEIVLKVEQGKLEKLNEKADIVIDTEGNVGIN